MGWSLRSSDTRDDATRISSAFGYSRGKYPRSTVAICRPLIAFIGSENRGFAVTNDHTHAGQWTNNWSRVVLDITPDRHRTGTEAEDRTIGSANYLYADGSVETLPAIELKALIDEGIIPAIPP